MSVILIMCPQAGALVHVYTDGSVLLTHAGTEMGQGLHTKMIQVQFTIIYPVYVEQNYLGCNPEDAPIYIHCSIKQRASRL